MSATAYRKGARIFYVSDYLWKLYSLILISIEPRTVLSLYCVGRRTTGGWLVIVKQELQCLEDSGVQNEIKTCSGHLGAVSCCEM